MDPFIWWKNHKNEYPTVSLLVMYCCNFYFECLFSKAGNAMTAKRTKLNPLLFERIVFLKKNMQCVENIFPDE